MSKPQPCLPQMPLHIKEKIVEKVDPLERFTIRKVSKEFRELADNAPAHFKEINFHLCTVNNRCIITLETLRGQKMVIEYRKAVKGCDVEVGKKKTFIPGKLHVEKAVLELATILKNPKLTMQTFHYHLADAYGNDTGRNSREKGQFCKFFTQELQKLDHQLHVEIVYQGSGEDPKYLMSFLPFLKSDILWKFHLELTANKLWSKVSETEQWKMAKVLDSRFRNPSFEDIRCDLAHFKRVRLDHCKMDLEDIKVFIEEIFEKKVLVHYKFHNVGFGFKEDFEEYMEEFPNAYPRDDYVKRIKDPNSDFSFLCRLTKDAFEDHLDFYKDGVDVDAKDEDDEEEEEEFDDEDEEEEEDEDN